MQTDESPATIPDPRPRRRTVIRVLLVIVAVLVMGPLLGMLFMVVRAAMTPGAAGRAAMTQASLNSIKMATREYHLSNAAYPPGLATLQSAKFLEDGALVDAWRRPFAYTINPPGSTPPVQLFSCGPDGTPGTPDDISVPWP